jgi:hypothetical protein
MYLVKKEKIIKKPHPVSTDKWNYMHCLLRIVIMTECQAYST